MIVVEGISIGEMMMTMMKNFVQYFSTLFVATATMNYVFK